MIEIRIPKEVTDYKAKLFFGLTTRQCLSVGLALIINVPLYYFGKNYIPEDILSWLIIIITCPLVLFGFFKYNGMTFEKIAGYFINYYLKTQKRKFVYEKTQLQKVREELVKEDFLSRIFTSKDLKNKYHKHFWVGIKEERLYYKYLNEWKSSRGRTKKKKKIRGKRVKNSVI